MKSTVNTCPYVRSPFPPYILLNTYNLLCPYAFSRNRPGVSYRVTHCLSKFERTIGALFKKMK